MKKDRIPEQVLPGNYYDGEVLYGSEMNKIVNILRTGVNANKTDIDNLILDVEKYASITNLGIIDPSELDDISQEGIYKYSVQRPDGGVDNGLLFHTLYDSVAAQARYEGRYVYVRTRSSITNRWYNWQRNDLSDINLNKSNINNLNNTLNSVENKVNKNTDDISDLNFSLRSISTTVSTIISALNKKLDKETNLEQEVNGKVNFREGIETDFIHSNGLVIENDTVFGINADKKVSAGEYYEGLVQSDDTRLATRKYVADKFAELVEGSPEALDTIYELAEALQNNPDVINELLREISNLQDFKVDKSTTINGKSLNSNINLTKEDIGLDNVDNTSDLDKPISRAVQLELDKKANNADLAPILNLENTGFFEKYGNILQFTTEVFIRSGLYYKVFVDLGFQTPIRIGIRNNYGDKYLILTDSPIQDFEGIVEYYDSIKQVNAKITIWERQSKETERQNVKQYVKFFRNDVSTDWESIAYESDIEKVEQELLNEISEVDAKSTENKNTIDKIISGRQTVGKALTAVNLTSQERQPIEDLFSTRITAKYENEIISSIDEDTTAEIAEIGGFSVKQLVKDGETTVELTQNNVYLAKASGTNITLSSGTQTIELPKGIAKFTASESETYTFNGTNLANCKVYSLTEMGIAGLSLEQANQLLGNKSYPYGITNTKPSKLISVGENLFDWREFYDALKAVNPDNVEIVNKDGRECIKITNPRVYANAGIKLWQGKFAPNVSYRFSSWYLNEGTTWGFDLRVRYTDGSVSFFPGYGYQSSWTQRVYDTVVNKTIDYIEINYGSNSTITYFDINTMQLQMLDNPETNFIPYSENEVELPAYADYGIPRLPNGVRDRIFRLGNSPDNSEWFYEKNVEKIILNGSEDFVWQGVGLVDEVALFYYAIDNIKRSTWPQQLHVMNDFFTSVRHENIYKYGEEGIASRSDKKGLTVGIKKSRIPGWDDNWTPTRKANAFKQWLQANPITVYYQLDEPQLTRIGNYNSQYLAYNYGREEIVDSEGNTTPTYTVIKYYPDYVKQTQTSSEIIAIQQTTIQSLQSQLESIEARIKALEDEKDS